MRTFYDTFLFIDGLGFLGAGGHCLITWILILFFACVEGYSCNWIDWVC